MARPPTGAFTPNTAGTVTISATQASAATALVGSGCEITITNAGASTVFMEQGDSTITAAVATGFPVLAGEVITIGRNKATTHVATICNTGLTATVYVSTGEGS